ncbi:hypothetical protein OOJ09_27125 [Mesorhizobium qingshengii]|jgi:hypothetical protein|uniref:Uncharacterized protein n=1 Tax=Mesorhizobium qingshengii TaxID=1165689 RepID=A0ABT4R2T4_9HYPH|nr:hypothetical protein [Mesorhizobium qingshengii]MCZ8547873.1 hypothetical protein [Mesorhizobium qingshengii]
MGKDLTKTDWPDRLTAMTVAPLPVDPTISIYFKANIDAIRAALAGVGPDVPGLARKDLPRHSGMGASMVANISSAHVPAVCEASLRGDDRPYKNGYDLAKYHVGSETPDSAGKLREIVDRALPVPDGKTPADLYFGAMELNGTGVYFYGDICLVLKTVPDETTVLASNSYDLVRAPLKNVIEDGHDPDQWPQRRADEALRMSGSWGDSRDAIAAVKVFSILGVRPRRLTTGQISDALRVDEDYVEILRLGSFGTQDLSEARVSAADAACEAGIADRRRMGPAPPLESQIWRDRRRVAEKELRKCAVPVRIVTTTGRVKG